MHTPHLRIFPLSTILIVHHPSVMSPFKDTTFKSLIFPQMVHKSCGSRKTHVRVHQTFRQIRPNERSHLKLLCYAAMCRNLNFSFIVIIKHLSSCRGSFFTPLQSPGLVFFSDSFHGDPGIPFGSKPSEEYFRRFCLFFQVLNC